VRVVHEVERRRIERQRHQDRQPGQGPTGPSRRFRRGGTLEQPSDAAGRCHPVVESQGGNQGGLVAGNETRHFQERIGEVQPARGLRRRRLRRRPLRWR